MTKTHTPPTPRPPEPDTSLWTPQQREDWAMHKRAMARFDSLTKEERLKLFVKTGVLNPDGTPTEHLRGDDA